MSAANIATLVATLTAAREAYYNLKTGKTPGVIPMMSDAQYDAMEDELRKLDPTNAFFAKIGAPSTGAWIQVAHKAPMTSLNKAQTKPEMEAWFKECGGGQGVVIMDKLDGASLSIRYENRRLVQALTRGDGDTGDDVTRNVVLMQGVVKMLPSVMAGVKVPDEVFVRGEVIITHSDFKAHFPGESNPRNSATGTMKRQSNNGICAHATVMVYELRLGDKVIKKSAELDALLSAGFKTPRYTANPLDTPVDIENLYQQYIGSIRKSLDYDIDGLVLCIDDGDRREALGETGHKPKGAIAYKFPHEEKPSTIRNIRWQVGNSGRITPVAEFDVVNLGGANVTNASLANISIMEDLCQPFKLARFHVGDRILVSRRNDVIPKVEALLVPSLQGTLLDVPTNCPSCAAILIRDGEYLVCKNEDCEAQAAGSIKRWVKKLDVKFVGESLIEAMAEAYPDILTDEAKKQVRYKKDGSLDDKMDPADLYTLDPQAVADLDVGGGRAGASASKAIKNLTDKMTLPIYVIVGSLGIPNIGRGSAKSISDAGFNTLSKMLKAKFADIAAIPGIGDSKAKDFVEGFQAKAGLIAKLLANGIQVQVVSGHLLGMTFCPTGFRSAELAAAIEKAGGSWTESFSRKCTYLICKDPSSTGSKAAKAASYGTKIIDIDDAWKLVNGK